MHFETNYFNSPSISLRNSGFEGDFVISEEFKTDVLAHTDIVQLVSSYAELKKSGNNFKGFCIFHKEKTPSFSVSPEKQIFKCFGCGKGGNAIEFIKLAERKNYPEAVYSLALRAGLIEAIISDLRGTVYVLELEHGMFYIGFTQNLEQRMEAHFSGSGSSWTKTHPPVKLLETFLDVPFDMENEIATKYMSQYGWQRVRGGIYCYKYLSYSQIPDALHRKKKDGAYLLSLSHGKYYVGFDQDMEKSIQRQFDGKGVDWTKTYHPQQILKKVKSLNPEIAKDLTLQAMKDYGWENVRGYRWTTENITKPKELDTH